MDENTHELKRAKIISKIKEMRLMDDDFMTAVLSDKACAELVIRIILDRNDITVKETKTQYTINSLRTHSVRLDVYAEDTNGKKYDIEIQRSDSGANPQRARYISSMIDSDTLLVGEDYSKLPEGKVKVENPELELTTIYYMQEIRRKPGIGQQPRFREMEEEMITHFREGTFIVPVQTADKENGEKESKVPFMKMKNGDIYQPIFTDMPEFFKFCRDGKFRAAVIPYEKLNAVILKQAKGIIMNPFGVRLILNKGQF